MGNSTYRTDFCRKIKQTNQNDQLMQWHIQPKNLGVAKNLGGPKCMILGVNTILFGKTPLKAQNDYIFQNFLGGMAPLAHPWLRL